MVIKTLARLSCFTEKRPEVTIKCYYHCIKVNQCMAQPWAIFLLRAPTHPSWYLYSFSTAETTNHDHVAT